MEALQEGAEPEQEGAAAPSSRAGSFETISEHDGSADGGATDDAEFVLATVRRHGEGAARQVLHHAPLRLHAHVLARTTRLVLL